MQNHTIWQSAIGGTDAGGTDTCWLRRARQRKRSVWQTRRQGQLQVPLRGWGEGPEVMCSTAASVKCQEGQAVSVSTSRVPRAGGVLWRPQACVALGLDGRQTVAAGVPRRGGWAGGRPLGRAAGRPAAHTQHSASRMARGSGVRSGAATSGRSSGAPGVPSGGPGARAARRGWTCAPSGGTRRGRRGGGARGRSTCARARRRPSRP